MTKNITIVIEKDNDENRLESNVNTSKPEENTMNISVIIKS